MPIYDKQIISILAKAGERGMSVKKIGMQLYNINCTLFDTPDFKEIHKYVQQFLLRNSKTQQSLVFKTNWGIYKLNPNSSEARQLVIDFGTNVPKEEETMEQDIIRKDSTPDLSLSLFDFLD